MTVDGSGSLESFRDRAAAAALGEPWTLDEPLTPDGTVRVTARGDGACAREIVLALVARARRWTGEDLATQLARRAAVDTEARDRLRALSRRAEVGGMTGSFVHELATVLTCLQHNLDALEAEARGRDAGTDVLLDEALSATGRRLPSAMPSPGANCSPPPASACAPPPRRGRGERARAVRQPPLPAPPPARRRRPPSSRSTRRSWCR